MKKSIKDFFILFSVFITGASVLVVEITAIRILSPYYGNTLYTASSVIGVVLAALSIGYYTGGKISDKHPVHSMFYGIIFGAGIFIISIEFLRLLLLPTLGAAFPITIGPFISSILLFIFPCFLLGLLSPYAIKLSNNKEEAQIGQRSGEVFFWSTLGSISGSIATGFFFIPHLGVNLIILITGIALSLLAIAGSILSGIKLKRLLAAIGIVLVMLVIYYYLIPQKNDDILYEGDGVYERITISDGFWNNQPARFLFQDKSYSAAMYHNTEELAYEYTKYYALHKLFKKNPENAFIIGGGAYSIPKALMRDYENISIDVTEIEPDLYYLAKKYFHLQDSSNLKNFTQDGRYFLTHTNNKYDMIISDVYYSFFSIPVQFTTKEFFSLAKNHLSENGVFIGNFVGDLYKNPPSFIFSEIKTFKSVFPNSYFFAVENKDSSQGQNIIFLGVNGSQEINFSILNLIDDDIIQSLPEHIIDLSDINFSLYREITDNFSPVEYYISKSITRWSYRND